MTKLDADDVLTEKTPFLSCLGLLYPENAIVSDVIDWFRYGINCLDFEKPADALLSDSAFMIADMPEEIRKDALRLLKELTPDVDQWQVETCEENGEEYLNVTAVHTVDGVKTQLALQEEPLYVRKMFILLPFLMYSLACGTVLAVDGLDLGLEPELVECLLMFYQNPEANQTGAQLITTAHGTSAMEFVDIRQDEFWYVEKGRQQDTKIYSLLDLGQDDQEEPPGGYTGPHAL